MATNKNAMIRYQALDKCLSNRYKRYYIEDLIAACCEALKEYSDKAEPVHKRQVQKDIDFIDEHFSEIERVNDGRRKYFRYVDENFSLSKKPLTDEEINKLQETIFMLRRFDGMPHFLWMDELLSHLEDRFNLKGQSVSVIGFEQNLDYTGSIYLSDLFNHIVSKQSLRIIYQKEGSPEIVWERFHPYYIKQFNNRWFLFGFNEDIGAITNAMLDRIKSITPVGIPYIENTSIDFEEYFDDVVGVTIPPIDEEHIILKFSTNRFQNVVSKPLHRSMHYIDRSNCIVGIKVKPNRELMALLLSFGSDVEILEPEWYRTDFIKKINAMSKIYQTNAQ